MSVVLNTDILVSLLPPLSQDDGIYRFLRGKECNLATLRSKLQNPSSISTEAKTILQTEEDANPESILHQTKSVSVTIQNMPSTFENVKGCLILSTKRVFFVTMDEKDDSNDFSIDAQCISLHAMMSDPEASVYCQLADGCVSTYNNNDESEETMGPAEIFFHPVIDEGDDDVENKKSQRCQTLFESFSKLINLNPVHDDEDDGNAFGGLGAMLGMLGNDDDDDGDEDNEMICRIDPSQIGTNWDEKLESGEGGGASNSERNAMLQRLDNMLVVPPEYEIDGQFDDAEEEEGKDHIMDEEDKNIL